MGTLLQKLEYLEQTKIKIREVLKFKGAKVTDEDTFRSYADYIRKIEGAAAGVVDYLEAQGTADGIGGGIEPKVQITSIEPGNASIRATWTAIPNATKYRVFTYLNGEYTKIGDTTGTTYTITGLTNGTEYGVYVIAYANKWIAAGTSYIVYATPEEYLTNFALRNLEEEEEENKKSEEDIKSDEGEKRRNDRWQ